MLMNSWEGKCNWISLSKQSSQEQSYSLFGTIHLSSSRSRMILDYKNQLAKISYQNLLMTAVVNITTSFKICLNQTKKRKWKSKSLMKRVRGKGSDRAQRRNHLIRIIPIPMKRVILIVPKISLDWETAWVECRLQLTLNLNKSHLCLRKKA